MKKALCIVAICALVVAMFGTSVLAADVTVKGKVEAAAKDAAGKVTAVSIVTDSGKVAVAGTGKGKALLNEVGKTVEATGVEITAADGAKTLEVKSFKVIPEAAPAPAPAPKTN